MEETWKDIPNYEGLYQVSNLGRVKSLKRFKNNHGAKQLVEEKIKSVEMSNSGYLQVCLYKNGKGNLKYIHKLVANTFLENPNNYPCINHKDENKANNKLSNLEFCNYEYNNSYGMAFKNRLTPINQYDKNGIFLKKWESISRVEKELEISHNNIISCCKKRRKTAGGFIWEYA